jgi:ABC-type uncharacterized transport system ATPase subunit
VLARELALPGLKLLVAAQPTRGLDVGAVEAIYGHIRAAAQRGVAVLLASSELDELLAVADRPARDVPRSRDGLVRRRARKPGPHRRVDGRTRA